MLVEVLKEIEYYCHNSYLERLEVSKSYKNNNLLKYFKNRI